MKLIYEEYSADRGDRFRIYDNGKYLSVVVEHFFEEFEIEGHIEPAEYREVRDGMLHHVSNIEEGIRVGKELLINI